MWLDNFERLRNFGDYNSDSTKPQNPETTASYFRSLNRMVKSYSNLEITHTK